MLIVVDKYFIKVLRRHGYDISFEELATIMKEVRIENQKEIDLYNANILRQIEAKKKK